MGNPDAPPLDTERLILTLAEHGVAYVIVGGIAAIMHGSTSATFDFDLVPKASADNLDALADALRALNAALRLEDGSTIAVPLDRQALSQYELSTWRTDAGDLDVIRGIPTAEGMIHLAMHDELAETGVRVTVFDTQVTIADLDAIITSKETADRDVDHASLPALRSLRDRSRANDDRS